MMATDLVERLLQHKTLGAAPREELAWLANHGSLRQLQTLETSVPGIFAAGDLRAGAMNRVASAVGEGSMVVRLTHEYLALT
jgi:thioredoxin reductase